MATGNAPGRRPWTKGLVLGALALGFPLVSGCAAPDSQARVLDSGPRIVSAPAAQERQAPADLRTPAAPGTVTLRPGVFTDVLELDHATLTPGRQPAVEAELGNLIDAAPLLQLEVHALFYDDAGKYLGTAAYVEEGHGENEEGHESHEDEDLGVLPLQLEAEVPLGGEASSAVLDIVQFVTE